MFNRNADRPFRLDARFIKNLTAIDAPQQRYSDGPGAYGLSLLVRRASWGGLTKTFSQRVRVNGKLTNIGLGPWPLVTLEEAREAGARQRLAPSGKASTCSRTGARSSPARRRSGTWSSGQSRPTRRAGRTPARSRRGAGRSRDYVFPTLGDKRADAVTTADVLGVVLPLWHDKRSTANKVASFLSRTFAYAIVEGVRADNPADGKTLSSALPRTASTVEHFKALRWQDVDAALTAVSRSTSGETAKLAVEWVAVTACRSGEARGATWAEIDGNEWTIPAARMKAARPHRVPLSAAALDVLRRAHAFKTGEDGLLFPSARNGAPLADRTLARIFHDLGHRRDDSRLAVELPRLVRRAGRRPCRCGDGARAQRRDGDGAGLPALRPRRAAARGHAALGRRCPA